MCQLGPEDLLSRILTTLPHGPATSSQPAHPRGQGGVGKMIRWRSGVVFTCFGIISPVWVLWLLSHQICGHHFGVSGEVTLAHLLWKANKIPPGSHPAEL